MRPKKSPVATEVARSRAGKQKPAGEAGFFLKTYLCASLLRQAARSGQRGVTHFSS
jgi:hypothetical protein